MTDLAANIVCRWEVVSGEQRCSYFNAKIKTSLCQARNYPARPGEIPSKLCILTLNFNM